MRRARPPPCGLNPSRRTTHNDPASDIFHLPETPTTFDALGSLSVPRGPLRPQWNDEWRKDDHDRIPENPDSRMRLHRRQVHPAQPRRHRRPPARQHLHRRHHPHRPRRTAGRSAPALRDGLPLLPLSRAQPADPGTDHRQRHLPGGQPRPAEPLPRPDVELRRQPQRQRGAGEHPPLRRVGAGQPLRHPAAPGRCALRDDPGGHRIAGDLRAGEAKAQARPRLCLQPGLPRRPARLPAVDGAGKGRVADPLHQQGRRLRGDLADDPVPGLPQRHPGAPEARPVPRGGVGAARAQLRHDPFRRGAPAPAPGRFRPVERDPAVRLLATPAVPGDLPAVPRGDRERQEPGVRYRRTRRAQAQGQHHGRRGGDAAACRAALPAARRRPSRRHPALRGAPAGRLCRAGGQPGRRAAGRHGGHALCGGR